MVNCAATTLILPCGGVSDAIVDRGSFGSLRGTKDRGILSNISSLYCSYIVNTYYIVLTLHATTNYVA